MRQIEQEQAIENQVNNDGVESMKWKCPKTPKSFCVCGHTGDGQGSQHGDTPEPGHGRCIECKCEKFRWGRFIEPAVKVNEDSNGS